MAASAENHRFRSFREGQLVLARQPRHPFWAATIGPCTTPADVNYGKWKATIKGDGYLWCEFIEFLSDKYIDNNLYNIQACWVAAESVKAFTLRDADYTICRCRTQSTKERLSHAVKVAAELYPDYVTPNAGNPHPINSTAGQLLERNKMHRQGEYEDDVNNANGYVGNNGNLNHSGNGIHNGNSSNPASPPPSSENAEEDDDEDSDDGGYDRGIDAMERAVLDVSYKINGGVPDMNVMHMIGDLVLAKTGTYPFWPAVVSKCVSEKEKWDDQWVLFATKKKPLRLWCSFVGDSTGGWVPLERMRPYSPTVAQKLMSKPKARLYNQHKEAVRMADEMFNNQRRVRPRSPVNNEANGAVGNVNGSSNDEENAASGTNNDEDATQPADISAEEVVLPPKLEYAEKDIVLAKFDESLPFWPAFIHKCGDSNAENHLLGKWHIPATATEPEKFCCFFIVDGSECWVPLQQMKRFSVARAKSHLCSKSSELYDNQKDAIEQASKLYRERQEEQRLARLNITLSWKVGDIVLAKFPHCPFWPGRIQRCTTVSDKNYQKWRRRTRSSPDSPEINNIASPAGDEHAGDEETGDIDDMRTSFWCSFLLNETSYWVDSTDIKPFTTQRARQYFVAKNHSLFDYQKQAINLAEQLSVGGIIEALAPSPLRDPPSSSTPAIPESNAEIGSVEIEKDDAVQADENPPPPKRSRNSKNSSSELIIPPVHRRSEPMTPRNEPMTPRNSNEPAADYFLGDLVLVPFQDNAYWPARIVHCPSHEEKAWKEEYEEEEITSYWCAYIHYAEAVWVTDLQLKPFTPHRARRYLVSKSSRLGKKHREAVRKASDICRNMRNRVEVSLTEFLDASIVEEMEKSDEEQEEEGLEDMEMVHSSAAEVEVENEMTSRGDTLVDKPVAPAAEKPSVQLERVSVEPVQNNPNANTSPNLDTTTATVTPAVEKPSSVQKEASKLVDNLMSITREKIPFKSVPSVVTETGVEGKASSGEKKDGSVAQDAFSAPIPVETSAVKNNIPAESQKIAATTVTPPATATAVRVRSPTPMRSPTSMASTSGPMYPVPLPSHVTTALAPSAAGGNKIPIPRSVPLKSKLTPSISSSEGGRKSKGSRFSDVTPQEASVRQSRFSSPSATFGTGTRNSTNGNISNTINHTGSGNGSGNIGKTIPAPTTASASALAPASGSANGHSVPLKNTNGQLKDGITTTVVGLGNGTRLKNSSISGKRPRIEFIEASGSIKKQK